MSTQKKRVVVIGGGTGTHTLLRGLSRYQKQLDLTAIVTMADSGGSTGRLRDEFGYLPVGDVRMALAALASDSDEHEALVRQLFMYRFAKGDGLSGHTFGNLLLVALTDILGSEEAAIRAAARVLRVEGSVIPVTTEPVHLKAIYSDGYEVIGEHEIDEPPHDRHMHTVADLSVTPPAMVNPRAEDALLAADLIILGPGDLYTSILANCVVGGVSEAIRHSTAQVVYVSNLMTRAGQTAGMGVAAHVTEIVRYTARQPDVILVNTGVFPVDLIQKYEAEDEYPVIDDYTGESMVIRTDLLATETVTTVSGDTVRRSLLRHDPRRLARSIMDIVTTS